MQNPTNWRHSIPWRTTTEVFFLDVRDDTQDPPGHVLLVRCRWDDDDNELWTLRDHFPKLPALGSSPSPLDVLALESAALVLATGNAIDPNTGQYPW